MARRADITCVNLRRTLTLKDSISMQPIFQVTNTFVKVTGAAILSSEHPKWTVLCESHKENAF